ncbi:MAG: TIGR03986 family CRISPR-associated RAMP protein [Clostridiales bacterium]|nr:TIGR03986 family CRISPR-associated RAMP protein [Clostridiales bacterium]
MGKKNNKNRSNDSRRSGRSDGSLQGALASIAASSGFEVPKAEEEKPEENKYKNNDPDKKKRNSGNRNNQHGRGSFGNGRGSSVKQGIRTNQKVITRPQTLREAPHAPYNFVRMDRRVMETVDIPAHDRIASETEDLFTGYIQYDMTAQTPILVDSGHNSFYRSQDGEYAIPGSTIRGLIRNNLQILSFSGLMDDIDDYYLMYRAVASGCLKDEYNSVLGAGTISVDGHQISVLKNVKAGYIECRGKDYYLYGNVGDSDGSFQKLEANYYAVSERYVLERARENFKCLIPKFQNEGPFKRKEENGTIHYEGKEKESYKPYYQKITYSLSNKRVYQVKKNGLEKKGYVTSTGMMKYKKVFYVIPEMDPDSGRKIPEESVTAFQIDYNRRENTIAENCREFYQLPKDSEIRPVFYINLDGKLYFGYTPRLRLLYAHSIAEGLKQDRTISCDYAKAMFGYSDDKVSLKSRVFFTDARLTDNKGAGEKQSLVLAEPKPTSYLEYLKQGDEGDKVATYNSDRFELRGVKQYWLQKDIRRVEINPENTKLHSEINPLAAGNRFQGKVRFHNLTKTELGLLLWSIRLEKNSQMNVGKAKAYGYGRVKVDDVDLYIQNPEISYRADSAIFGIDPFVKKSSEERDAYVDAYLKVLAKWLGVSGPKEVMQNPSVSDFFKMKSFLAEGRTVEYMELKNPQRDCKRQKAENPGFAEYKKKNCPLPTVDDIVDGEN